jgi:hypothetical protein
MCPGHFVVSFSENDLKVMPGAVSEGGGRLERMSIVEMCAEEELRSVEVMREPCGESRCQR